MFLNVWNFYKPVHHTIKHTYCHMLFLPTYMLNHFKVLIDNEQKHKAWKA